MYNRPVYDGVALLARCGVGAVFLAHGWQKIQVGVTATGRNLDALGAPSPTAAAVFSTFVELLGGVALILGLALPVAGALLFLDMAGAFVFVHAKHGIFLVDQGHVHNGSELVLVLGLAALVFAAGGGGRLTLDNRLFGAGSRRGPSSRSESRREPGTEPFPAGSGEGSLPAASGERSLPSASGERSVQAVSRKRRLRFRSKGRSSAHSTGQPKREQPPDRPSAARRPGAPSTEETPSTGPRPRLASEIVTDTSRDVIVAGNKDKPSADDTTPIRTRKKPPKSDV